MKQLFLHLGALLVLINCRAQAIPIICIPTFDGTTAQQLFDEYRRNPQPFTLHVGHAGVPTKGWADSITQQISWSNAWYIVKTAVGAVFFVATLAVCIIRTAYSAASTIGSFVGCRQMQIRSAQRYTILKKYKLLFVAYIKMDEFLKHNNIRHHFPCNTEYDETIAHALAYLAWYDLQKLPCIVS